MSMVICHIAAERRHLLYFHTRNARSFPAEPIFLKGTHVIKALETIFFRKKMYEREFEIGL